MIEVIINNNESLKLPENWDEIIQLNFYHEVVACLYKEHENEESKLLDIFAIITKFNGLGLGKLLNLATPAERQKKAESLDFAFSMEIKEKIFPLLDFLFEGPYTCPYQTLEINNIKLVAPGEKTYDQTGHEMMLSHFSMTHYANSSNENDMNMLIAINYHYAIDGKRQKFNEEALDDIYCLIEKMPFNKRLGIYHWLCQCDLWWYNKYKHLFEKEDDLQVSISINNQADTWRKLLLKLADNKLGVDYDRIISRSRQDLFYLLDELDSEMQKKEIEEFDK